LPTLAAALVASLAGWLIDDVAQPYLGAAFTVFLSLVCSTVVFYAARKWLIDLRG
jgi:hypothetical protein